MIREIYGKKIGMTQIFDTNGDLVAVTLIEVNPIKILEEKYYASKSVCKIGCFKIAESKTWKVSKPLTGYFKKLGVSPYKLIREVEKDLNYASQNLKEGEAAVPVSEFGVDLFKEGEIVDVRGKTKGRGFAGGMKRHGWAGQPKTHGSTSHRRIGSAGSSAYPSKVIKGLHMPGHMGNVWRTSKKIRIVKIDAEKQLIFVDGSVPGSRGGIVAVRKEKNNKK